MGESGVIPRVLQGHEIPDEGRGVRELKVKSRADLPSGAEAIDTAKRLKRKAVPVLPGKAATSDLVLFRRSGVSEIKGIRVFDVGQGDCIGLLDQRAEVFCYVDYGGLADHPDAAKPANTRKRLPVGVGSRKVSIVLTHWDKDHYWSAKHKNPAAQACEWLVPRQMASPQAALFAADLPRAKCWPENRTRKAVRMGVGTKWDIEIRKCGKYSKNKSSEDRNRTGLAITILEWEGRAISSVMLVPGDCAFHLIPELPKAPLRGLVAYHHGAQAHWTKATEKAIARVKPRRRMVYSFGKNDYGHPSRKNYRPHWDRFGTRTADLRARGKRSQDIYWH